MRSPHRIGSAIIAAALGLAGCASSPPAPDAATLITPGAPGVYASASARA